MYEILVKAHGGLAMLALLLTLAWGGVALATPSAGQATMGGVKKAVYIGAVALTSLVGLLGLILALMAPAWFGAVFTWVGIAVLVAYPIAGARSRRALAAGNMGMAAGLSVVMLVLVAITYWLMLAKPF